LPPSLNPSNSVAGPACSSPVGPRSGARGSLTVITGCMFSGKTTSLLDRLESSPRPRALAFKHATDSRYSPSQLVSHAGRAWSAVVVRSAREILDHVRDDIELAVIDEGHFFCETLIEVAGRLVDDGREVLIAALQPDSWGRPFRLVSRLSEIADQPVATYATCAGCGGRADRTQRLTPIVNGQMVVEAHHYEPRCRPCWRPPPNFTADPALAGSRVSGTI